jgi:hypothetical protein
MFAGKDRKDMWEQMQDHIFPILEQDILCWR